MTSWSSALAGRVADAFGGAADPSAAGPMRAYMRDQFPFLGITTPHRRRLTRALLAGAGAPPSEADLLALAEACWRLDEREYQYFAVDVLIRYAKTLTPASLPAVAGLLTGRSWWDTVDALASRVVGPVVAAHPPAVPTMDAWAASGQLWLARTAILHQLGYGPRTDTDRLYGYCETLAGHPDFFIRKAIGWALRQYARTDPDGVRAFVAAHPELSGLSRREALKHL